MLAERSTAARQTGCSTAGRTFTIADAPAYDHAAAMGYDELEALRRITQRRQRAEGEWRMEIRRLFEAGHSIEEIPVAGGVPYDVVLAIVRPS